MLGNYWTERYCTILRKVLKILLLFCHVSGAYPGGRTPRGPTESLILAPWSKVEECCPHPPYQFGAPKLFFLEPLHPFLHVDLLFIYVSFLFLVPFFPSFPFLFGAHLVTWGPKAPHGIKATF